MRNNSGIFALLIDKQRKQTNVRADIKNPVPIVESNSVLEIDLIFQNVLVEVISFCFAQMHNL